MKNKENISRTRLIIQIIMAVFFNGYVIGFAKGKIFTGATKALCVPVLNCYSCPGALGSCPIGALQSVLGGRKHRFPFYVLGFIMLFGIVFGRFICGFLCPFGLIQDLLHKIPVPKIKVPNLIDKPLRFLKYIILILFVILMPLFFTNDFGISSPYFCKWICPVGTLEGGIPLVFLNESLRNGLGFLFNFKITILIVILVLSLFIYRPFCKYLCPLGALYAFFNKFSLYQMELDKEKCIGCKKCERACKMNVKVTKNINSFECIRCRECEKACPVNAINSGFNLKKSEEKCENKEKTV